ncbi:sulfatase [Elusimicrobiota bacterium]
MLKKTQSLKKIMRLVVVVIIVAAPVLTAVFFNMSRRIDRVVIITIDTMRADHLRCYGYPRMTAPFIESLAQRGAVFLRAAAQSSSTSPSHASIFTSLYPTQHRVLNNSCILNSDFSTMAEMFRASGFQTAGIASTCVHFKPGNMDQGFDYFNEPYLPENTDSLEVFRPAKATIDKAIEWLGTIDTREKFFLWIHLFDTHYPYKPPGKFRVSPELSAKNGGVLADFYTDIHNVIPGLFDRYTKVFAGRSDRDRLVECMNLYDGEILFADTHLKKMFLKMVKDDKMKNMLIVLTADHGEGLGNHNYLQHGRNIYNEQLLVPLIFYSSSGKIKKTVINKTVELIDIMPTIADLVGGRVKEELKKLGNIEGISLLPLIKGDHDAFEDKFAFSRRRTYERRSGEKYPIVDESYESGEKYSIQNDEYKYIYRTHFKDELYNISEDCYETENIIENKPDIAGKLKARIMKKIDLFKSWSAKSPEFVDENMLKRLESLGYIK